MKKFYVKLLFSLAGLSLLFSSCSEPLEKGIDNYFKEYALRDYNDSNAVPFYLSIKNVYNLLTIKNYLSESVFNTPWIVEPPD